MSRKQRVCGFYDAFESGTASPDGGDHYSVHPGTLAAPFGIENAPRASY